MSINQILVLREWGSELSKRKICRERSAGDLETNLQGARICRGRVFRGLQICREGLGCKDLRDGLCRSGFREKISNAHIAIFYPPKGAS